MNIAINLNKGEGCYVSSSIFLQEHLHLSHVGFAINLNCRKTIGFFSRFFGHTLFFSGNLNFFQVSKSTVSYFVSSSSYTAKSGDGGAGKTRTYSAQ